MQTSIGLKLFSGSSVFATGVTGLAVSGIVDPATAIGWFAMAGTGIGIVIGAFGAAILKVRKEFRADQKRWEEENKGSLTVLLETSKKENEACEAERRILKQDLGTVRDELHDYRKDFLELSKLIAANRGAIARIELHEQGADR